MHNPFTPKEVLRKRRTPIERYFEFIDTKRASDKLFFYVFLLLALCSGAFLLLNLNAAHSVVIPTTGGELREGIVGSPRFVNPVLAITRADQDMVALIFDGLMTIDTSGELVPNIAESVTISSDALVYNIVLRDDVSFHDGTPLTADDVLFTVELIQNPSLKSPLQGNFDGVVVEKLGEYELNFVLQEPYTPFIENLTVGILPRHLWGDLAIDQIPFSQHNTEPIGSGPYLIDGERRNSSGLISGYTLKAFSDSHHRPKIESMVVSFFPNEQLLADALKTGKVDSAIGIAGNPAEILSARPDLTLTETPLPRTFGIFFNQNRSPALRRSEVREALASAINRENLIEAALNGRGEAIDSPVPPGFMTRLEATNTPTSTPRSPADILSTTGWSQNSDGIWSRDIDGQETELTIDIATANLPFLAETARYLETVWTELGARVSVRQFEQSDLTQAIIRTRDYEALLFGTAVGRNLDLYPFWHSSQRNDPGLNVALYANITADAALEDARTSTSTEERNLALEDFLTEFEADQPALFLYVPTMTAIAPEGLIREPVERVTDISERFANVEDWHIRTETVWPVFSNREE